MGFMALKKRTELNKGQFMNDMKSRHALRLLSSDLKISVVNQLNKIHIFSPL